MGAVDSTSHIIGRSLIPKLSTIGNRGLDLRCGMAYTHGMEIMTHTQLATRILRNGIKSFADARPHATPGENVVLADSMLYALRHLELEIEELRAKLEDAGIASFKLEDAFVR